MSECKYCKHRGKVWEGADPQCAFPKGVYEPDNWNCAAMNILRFIAEENENTDRDDDSAGSFGFVRANDYHAPEGYEGPGGYVTLAWYKDRGATNNAKFMNDEGLHEVTLDHVDMAILTNRYILLEQRNLPISLGEMEEVVNLAYRNTQ